MSFRMQFLAFHFGKLAKIASQPIILFSITWPLAVAQEGSRHSLSTRRSAYIELYPYQDGKQSEMAGKPAFQNIDSCKVLATRRASSSRAFTEHGRGQLAPKRQREGARNRCRAQRQKVGPREGPLGFAV